MTKEQVIETAVNWWAKKIHTPFHHDNGANDSANVMACFFADMGRKFSTEEQVEVFKRELTALLTDEYENRFGKSEYGNIIIGCDYRPCTMLNNAAKVAGINDLNFPFKTYMYIEAEKVKVSDGYCKPFVELEAESE